MTHHYKVGGLKQCIFIILQSWRAEAQNGSHWAEIKTLAGLQFPSGDLRKESISYSFQLLEAARIPWLMAPCHLQSQYRLVRSFLHGTTQILPLLPPSLIYLDPVIIVLLRPLPQDSTHQGWALPEACLRGLVCCMLVGCWSLPLSCLEQGAPEQSA